MKVPRPPRVIFCCGFGLDKWFGETGDGCINIDGRTCLGFEEKFWWNCSPQRFFSAAPF